MLAAGEAVAASGGVKLPLSRVCAGEGRVRVLRAARCTLTLPSPATRERERNVTLRLLADDLTGALDSAARFVPLVGPVPVSGASDDAAANGGDRCRHARSGRGRGRTRRWNDWRRCCKAPTSPSRRSTACCAAMSPSNSRPACGTSTIACWRRHSRSRAASRAAAGNSRATATAGATTGVDLPAALRACGLSVHGARCGNRRRPRRDRRRRPSAPRARAVVRHRWVGRRAGGQPRRAVPHVAAALPGADRVRPQRVRRPACGHRQTPAPHHRGRLAPARSRQQPSAARSIRRRSPRYAARCKTGAAAVCVALPEGTPRAQAIQSIGACFVALLAEIARPGTLVVAGGETLRRLCDALGVVRLEVDGEVVPGVPTSILRGGDWDGQRIVSKSGAFGDTGFLARLMTAHG